MERIKKYFHLLCHPKPGWFLPLSAIVLAAEIWVFQTGRTSSSYVFSTVITALVRKGWKLLLRIPLIRKLATDTKWRVELTLYGGLIFNTLYAVFKILAGFYYRSNWMVTAGGYYMVMAAVTFYLADKLQKEKRADKAAAVRNGLTTCRNCGLLLLPVAVSVISITVMVYKNDQKIRYPGTVIYAIALYAFICIILALLNIWKYRRLQDPVQSAVRRMKLSKAMYSIYMLQIAMLTTFTDGSWRLQRSLNQWTGIAVSAMITILAVLLILRAETEKRKQQRREEAQ